MLCKTALRQLSLPSKLALYMRERCKSLERPYDETTTSITSTSQLRQQLLAHRPHLAPILSFLSDYELSQLAHAVTDVQRQLIVQRKQYDSYAKTVHADAASLHASGVSKRSTSIGKLTNQQVQRRVAKEIGDKEKLRIAEVELERAVRGLRD